MMTLLRWSLSRLFVVAVVPVAVAAVVAKAAVEARARALAKSKGAYLAPFKILLQLMRNELIILMERVHLLPRDTLNLRPLQTSIVK